jgi:hypothetical protein
VPEIVRTVAIVLTVVLPGCLVARIPLLAQSQAEQQTPASSPSTQAPPSTPAQAVGLYVYPQKQQDKTLQSKDEGECYASAKTQSGVDPANLAASSPATPPPAAPKGGGAKGAAGGAAAGAAIGAVAGDAGQGAAIGATAGAIKGRRGQRKAKKQGEKEATSQQSAATQQNLDTFKRAMSACLDARGYSVK